MHTILVLHSVVQLYKELEVDTIDMSTLYYTDEAHVQKARMLNSKKEKKLSQHLDLWRSLSKRSMAQQIESLRDVSKDCRAVNLGGSVFENY